MYEKVNKKRSFFEKFVEDIKKIKEKQNKKIYETLGFETDVHQYEELYWKFEQIASYLGDGIRVNYQVKNGWMFIEENTLLNKDKVAQLHFKPYITKKAKKGYIRKIFQNNEFIFKIS